MTLIIIRPRPEMDMIKIMLLMLKYVYEEDKITPDEVRRMQEGIIAWSQYLKWKRDAGMCRFCHGSGMKFFMECVECFGNGYILSAVEEELEISLQSVAKMYQLNASGKLDDRKRLFAEHRIDYKKFHRVPGSVSEKDMYNGRKVLAEAMRKNPEDYQ
jgi:hypothetical protein